MRIPNLVFYVISTDFPLKLCLSVSLLGYLRLSWRSLMCVPHSPLTISDQKDGGDYKQSADMSVDGVCVNVQCLVVLEGQ